MVEHLHLPTKPDLEMNFIELSQHNIIENSWKEESSGAELIQCISR